MSNRRSAEPVPAAGPADRLRRQLQRLGLVHQALLLGGLASLLPALALGWAAGRWLPLPPAPAATAPWPLAWPALLAACLLAGGALATAALAWWAGVQARAWRQLDAGAQALRTAWRTEADDDDAADLPDLPQAAELQAASAGLRRLVALARSQRRALQQRNAQLGQQLQQRSHELSTLQDLSEGLAASDDLYQLVDEALKALEQTLAFRSASVWGPDRRRDDGGVRLMGFRLGDEDEGAPDAAARPARGLRLSRANLQRYDEIARGRRPFVDNDARQGLLAWLWEKVTDDASSSALYRNSRSWMGLPLRFREEVLGVLRVDHGSPGYFDAERARLLSAVCSQTALAMHHAQLLLQERELAVQAERSRIARDLHDAVSQTLFASNVIAGTLVTLAGRLPGQPALVQQAQALERLNRGALAEMRLLLYELRPDALEGMDLASLLQPALEALRCRGDIAVHADVAPADGLQPAQRLQLYRIAQEALSNIGRHSGAGQAHLLWQPDADDGPTLRIADDGQGFDTALTHPGHFGLENLRSRADDLGASLALRSAPGQGTEVCVVLPRSDTSPPPPES